MVSLKVMSYIIGGSLRDVRLTVASTDALTCGSAAREATGCRRTRSDPARPYVPGGMGRVPQGIATPLIAATRRLRMYPARQASARGGERDLHLEAGPALAIRPSPTQRPASRIGYGRSARSSPQVADAPIHPVMYRVCCDHQVVAAAQIGGSVRTGGTPAAIAERDRTTRSLSSLPTLFQPALAPVNCTPRRTTGSGVCSRSRVPRLLWHHAANAPWPLDRGRLRRLFEIGQLLWSCCLWALSPMGVSSKGTEPRSGSRRCPECGRGGVLVLNSYRGVRLCRRAAQGGPKTAGLVAAAPCTPRMEPGCGR
jgi:hypothetical protein